MNVINIGLFQFSIKISVTLVSVLFTPFTIGQSYVPTTLSLENVFIYLYIYVIIYIYIYIYIYMGQFTRKWPFAIFYKVIKMTHV